MKCHKCGTSLDKVDDFCPECGEKVIFSKEKKSPSYLMNTNKLTYILIILILLIGVGVFLYSTKIASRDNTLVKLRKTLLTERFNDMSISNISLFLPPKEEQVTYGLLQGLKFDYINVNNSIILSCYIYKSNNKEFFLNSVLSQFNKYEFITSNYSNTDVYIYFADSGYVYLFQINDYTLLLISYSEDKHFSDQLTTILTNFRWR